MNLTISGDLLLLPLAAYGGWYIGRRWFRVVTTRLNNTPDNTFLGRWDRRRTRARIYWQQLYWPLFCRLVSICGYLGMALYSWRALRAADGSLAQTCYVAWAILSLLVAHFTDPDE